QADSNGLSLTLKARNGVLTGYALLKITTRRGRVRFDPGTMSLRVGGTDEVLVTLTAATSFINYHDVSADPMKICHQRMQAIRGLDYWTLYTDHLHEYQQRFARFSIDLGHGFDELPTDERIERDDITKDPGLVALYV